MRWRFVTWLTVIATDLSPLLLKKRRANYEFKELGEMKEGSLGKSLFNCLNGQGLTYKPKLLRHDLKHILLGYRMDMPDELRIHAFLIGNKSYNPMAITYLLICICIVPEVLPILKKDYRNGKNTMKLKDINPIHLLKMDLEKCRLTLGIIQPEILKSKK